LAKYIEVFIEGFDFFNKILFIAKQGKCTDKIKTNFISKNVGYNVSLTGIDTLINHPIAELLVFLHTSSF
jgi:hypothetical protein